MKKIFLLLLISLFSLNLFSEEFSLFPWFCDQKEIYTQCINKGWKFHSDTYNKIPCYIFIPSDDVTYRSFPVYAITFLFNEKGDVISQSITFPKAFDSTMAFGTILECMVADKVQLLEKEVTENKYLIISYNGITNNLKVKYDMRGTDNLYQLSVAYFNY